MLRELARDAEGRCDLVSLQRIEEAYDMAKRMQNKLIYYNARERASSIINVDGVKG